MLKDVPVLLAAVIPCIEDTDPIDFDDEHGCPDDVPGYVGGDLDAVFLSLDSELD